MTLAPKPDNAAVRAYRDTYQCSLFEAKTALKKEWRAEQLQMLRLQSGELYTVEQCRDVIRDLIDLLSEALDT